MCNTMPAMGRGTLALTGGVDSCMCVGDEGLQTYFFAWCLLIDATLINNNNNRRLVTLADATLLLAN